MTKQPRSWWPVEGETRLSKRHDKVALGGEQVTSPYDEESQARVVTRPRENGNRAGAEPLHDGRRPWKVRRTWRCSTQKPAGLWGAEWSHSQSRNERDPSRPRPRLAAGCQLAVPGSSEAYKRKTREGVERRAEVGGGHICSYEGVDNITRRSEGPLARCATVQRPRRKSRSLVGRLDCSPTSWQDGMRPFDCLGERRMRENLMSGAGRGGRNRAEDAQPFGSLGGMSVTRLSPTSHCKDSMRRGSTAVLLLLVVADDHTLLTPR